METSKFVSLFLIAAFAFLFFYNVIILSDARLIPESAVSFLNSASATGWKFVASIVFYPVRIILVGPIIRLLDFTYLTPSFQVVAFTFYWTVLALVIDYLMDRSDILKQLN